MALEHYVKITNAGFLPDLLSDGDVWPCNLVTAKWVVDHGYGFYSDSAGVAAALPWGGTVPDVPAPELEFSTVYDADETKLVLDFDAPMSVTDGTGMTVEADAAGNAIVSAVASGDLVTLTLTTAIEIGEVVTFAYDGLGNLAGTGTGTPAVAAITELTVDNQVLARNPTGVTAGTPGSFTGGTGDLAIPADLTTLQGLGALGETIAWTTGQYVVLVDTSNAYWDSSAWVVGTAP